MKMAARYSNIPRKLDSRAVNLSIFTIHICTISSKKIPFIQHTYSISNFTFGLPPLPQIIVCFVIVRFLVCGVRIAGRVISLIFVSPSSLGDNLYEAK